METRIMGVGLFGENMTSTGENSATYGSYLMDRPTKTVIEPRPAGNAGTLEDNNYKLVLGFGNVYIKAVHNLPTLPDDTIAPANYTATMTLPAVPVIL
ncbi:MAG: hypothetical protein AAF655_14340 [Bacteroidota bacterium]